MKCLQQDVYKRQVTDEFLWQRDIMNKLKIPYVVLLGNHDCLGTGEETYRAIFGDCLLYTSIVRTAEVVLSPGSADSRIFLVTVHVELDFPFTPPAVVVYPPRQVGTHVLSLAPVSYTHLHQYQRIGIASKATDTTNPEVGVIEPRVTATPVSYTHLGGIVVIGVLGTCYGSCRELVEREGSFELQSRCNDCLLYTSSDQA